MILTENASSLTVMSRAKLLPLKDSVAYPTQCDGIKNSTNLRRRMGAADHS